MDEAPAPAAPIRHAFNLFNPQCFFIQFERRYTGTKAALLHVLNRKSNGSDRFFLIFVTIVVNGDWSNRRGCHFEFQARTLVEQPLLQQLVKLLCRGQECRRHCLNGG